MRMVPGFSFGTCTSTHSFFLSLITNLLTFGYVRRQGTSCSHDHLQHQLAPREKRACVARVDDPFVWDTFELYVLFETKGRAALDGVEGVTCAEKWRRGEQWECVEKV